MGATTTKPALKFKFLKRASELQPKPLRMLIYGEPGIGKTTFLSTLPRPTVVIDFEGGASTRLYGAEDIYIAEISNFEELREALREIHQLENIRSIAFDGFSVFLQKLLDEIVRNDPKRKGDMPQFKHWNLLTRMAQSIIWNLIRPKQHVVFTAFEKVEKNEKGEITAIYPDLPRSVRKYLRGLVDLEGRLTWDISPKSEKDWNERVLVFEDPIAETKDRTGKLSVEEPDFHKILAKVFGVKNPQTGLTFVPTPDPEEGEILNPDEPILLDEDFDRMVEEEIGREVKRKETKGATEKQRKFIEELAKNLGWTDRELLGFIKHLTGKESIAELSLNEASKVIAELKRQGR